MATHNLTTTNARETALQAKTDQANARRAAQTPPLAPLTATQYLQARVNDVLDDYVAQEQTTDADTLREAYRNAAPADKAAVKARLGLS